MPLSYEFALRVVPGSITLLTTCKRYFFSLIEWVHFQYLSVANRDIEINK